MLESLPTRLLLLLAEAPPEKLAVVERFLKGGPLLAEPPVPIAGSGQIEELEAASPVRYGLQREAACWVLDFQGQRALLKHEIGLAYVGYLLSHPGEYVPSATLFSEFSARAQPEVPAVELSDAEMGDGVFLAQPGPDRDEEEARSRYYAQLREYQETFKNSTLPGAEREEARRQYDELFEFLKRHYHSRPDRQSAVTKVVHKSIQRLCQRLRNMTESAALGFAEYLERHILVPSRRYTQAKAGSNVRIARGELAGRLVFECPPDHRWAVRG
jgi:hypothetical protein